MGVVFHHMTGPSAKAVLGDAYVELYLRTRTEPPYDSGPLYSRERFIERTTAQVERPGFELVSAENDGRVVGFAFGFTMGAGRWWGGEATQPPTEILQMSKVAVIELNVDQAYRARGIGKHLLGELLDGRTEPYATLLSTPDAPAHDMYLRWGWKIIGAVRPTPDAEAADAMVIALKAPS